MDHGSYLERVNYSVGCRDTWSSTQFRGDTWSSTEFPYAVHFLTSNSFVSSTFRSFLSLIDFSQISRVLWG